jgi:hypothetical protein
MNFINTVDAEYPYDGAEFSSRALLNFQVIPPRPSAKPLPLGQILPKFLFPKLYQRLRVILVNVYDGLPIFFLEFKHSPNMCWCF